MNKTTYTNYEQGKHSVPFDFAVTIAEFYNVSLDYIAGLTNYPQGKNKPEFTSDQISVAEKYSELSEKNKGKAELFIDQLLECQADKKEIV